MYYLGEFVVNELSISRGEEANKMKDDSGDLSS